MSQLQRILKQPQVEPVVSTLLRARIVDHPLRFALREWGLQRGAFVYRVRGTGVRVVVAHRESDIHALDQSFYAHSHEPPADARRALERLGRPLRALDVGANVGMWGLWLFTRFDVESVVGLEPDPANVVRHRRQIEINDLSRRWSIREQAATTANGPVHFGVGEGTNGAIRANADTQVDGVDVFSLVDAVDLLKIDIEGGEWPIVADPRFLELHVPVVMLEYHADGAYGEPRDNACRALESAGYAIEAEPEFMPGFGTVWGHRESSQR